MTSVNKAQILGRVGQPPNIKTTQAGDKIASLSVATSERWTDKRTGEKVEKTEWHRISVFNQQIVGVIEKFVKKGDLIYIEGQLQTRKWQDNNGIEKYTTEIVLSKFKGEIGLIGSHKNDSASSQSADYSSAKDGATQYQTTAQQLDDDIPF